MHCNSHNSSLSQISAISTIERNDVHSALHNFNKMFEDQLNSIEDNSQDCMKLKIQIYEEWVNKLLEEIANLIDCIQEMENQTALGLDTLTKNFNATHVPDERMKALTHDLNGLLELLRRARVYGQWDTSGLDFKSINYNDIFGDQTKNGNNIFKEFEQPHPNNPNLYTLNIEMNTEKPPQHYRFDEEKRHLKTTRISHQLPTAQDMCDIDDDHVNIMNDVKLNFAEQEILFKKIQTQNTELMADIEKLKERNKKLERSYIDTKSLAHEVATRHDEILKLKNENIALEDQLKSQDKTMCFKDELIKELRKDYKKFSSSTPPMSSKTTQHSINSEYSRNVSNADNINASDNVISEKNYDRKTNITNRLLEIFNFVQSSHQPSECICPSDSGILSDYMPTIGNDVISDEDLNNALMSFASRMNYLEKENVKLQVENDKLQEHLQEKKNEVRNLQKTNTVNPPATDKGGTVMEANMDIHLSDNSLLFNTGNVDKISNVVTDLNQEIESKDKLLSEKDGMIGALMECGLLKDRQLHDLKHRISSIQYISTSNEMVEKHLSDDGSMTVKDGDTDQLTQLVNDLKQEIKSKDKLLSEKNELISSLKESEISKNHDILELRKKIVSTQCNNNRNDETVRNLRDALDIHIKTINQQQLGNNHLENKIKDLQLYITNIDRNYVLLQEKYRKLELESIDQLTTISNLRSVVEEYSKRSGNATTNYYVSCKDNTSVDACLLNEQIYDLFNENVKYERKLNLLQDDNLYLRSEICLWSQDYSYLEEKYLDNLSETRDICENFSSIESRTRCSDIKCKRENGFPKSVYPQDTCSILQYVKNMEDNIIDELKNYKASVDEFKSFRDSIDELSSQINSLSEESKFSQKLIDDSTSMLGSYQLLQQENENLKNKLELSQNHTHLIETELTELKNEHILLKQEYETQKIQIARQIEEIGCIETDKKSLSDKINQNSVAVINNLTAKNADLAAKIIEQSHQWQKDIDHLNNVNRQEFQKSKDTTVQLANEIVQLKNMINEQNEEILKQSNALEKQKEDRYTMSKQLESTFEITEKLKFTIDCNLKSITHLQEENEKLKQELNQNIGMLDKLQADYNIREMEMINKTETLQQSIDDHIKERRISEKSLLDMSVQNQKLDQQNEDLVKEIEQLKDEIVRLKKQLNFFENNKSLMSDMQDEIGQIRSQLEKLLVNITENETELSDLRKQNVLLHQENLERSNDVRLHEQKLTKIIGKCREMKTEYDLLRNNYEKLLEIKESLTQSLIASQNAIDELKEREDTCNQLLAKQDEHIRTLLHDRSTLTTKIDHMHRDMIILNNRLESVDSTSNRYGPLSETVTRRTKLVKYRSVPSLNTCDETLQSIRKIKRKIYEARHFWQNGMHDAFY